MISPEAGSVGVPALLKTMLTPGADRDALLSAATYIEGEAGAEEPLLMLARTPNRLLYAWERATVYLPAAVLVIDAMPIPVLEETVGAPEAPMITEVNKLSG